MDDNFVMRPEVHSAPALDHATLSRLFDLGDASLRVALCAQLRDDFTRLHAAVGADCPIAITRAAHEMKGLAATVGAFRLADIATIVDTRAKAMGETARTLVVAQLRDEVSAVLAQLDQVARGGDAA